MARARRARFRGYNTDLSKVAQFKRDAGDVGSTEVQVAQLTARVSTARTLRAGAASSSCWASAGGS